MNNIIDYQLFYQIIYQTIIDHLKTLQHEIEIMNMNTIR